MESHGVSREHRGLTDVLKTAEEFHDTLETEACTGMGGSTVLERIDVVLDGLDGDALGRGSLGEHDRVVHSLSSRGDLLSAHEEIVRVGVVLVMRVKHGVEGASIDGVAVKHVEVSIVLLPDEATESLLGLSGQVLKRVLIVASFLQHGDSFLEVHFENWVANLELLERILLVDDGELATKSGLEVLNHVDHHIADDVKHFEVVILEFHLHIEASELAQMPVGVGVFSSEDGTDLEDATHVSAKSHLLVELGALGEARILVEILQLENVGTTL